MRLTIAAIGFAVWSLWAVFALALCRAASRPTPSPPASPGRTEAVEPATEEAPSQAPAAVLAELEAIWALTARTPMHVDDWRRFFAEQGYRGDYSWFIP